MNVFALKDMLAKIVKVSVYKENVGPVLVRSCQTGPINLCVRYVPNTQMQCPVKPYIFSFIAQPMGLRAFLALFPLKVSIHTAWTANDVLDAIYTIDR